MPEQQHSNASKPITRLAGINERKAFTNPDSGEFDYQEGLICQNEGILQRINGEQFLLKRSSGILGIYQTNDLKKNIIVQTEKKVYIYTEDEFFSRRTPEYDLEHPVHVDPVDIEDEEYMSKAILVHTEAAGTGGGNYDAANVWQTAPLNEILSQLNPDATPATFVTSLAANAFTLLAGTYRFRIRTFHYDSSSGIKILARLYNVTESAPAWDGESNEVSPMGYSNSSGDPLSIEFGGDLTLDDTTILRIEHRATGQQVTGDGFGFPANIASYREVYRWVEILKTA